jgi:hypothetical protein
MWYDDGSSWIEVTPGTTTDWGDIGGSIPAQTDLWTALGAKLDDSQLDVDGTLAANSDAKVATQKAVKTYVDASAGGSAAWGSITGTLSAQTDLDAALTAKLDDSQLDTDGTLAANSDSKIATQKAVKTYVDASAGGSGALVLLESHTASSSSSLDFTACFSSSYDTYIIEIVNLVVATDTANLLFRASTNGGSSYDSTSGHYQWTQRLNYATGTSGGGGGTSDTFVYVAVYLSNVSSRAYNATLTLKNPLQSSTYMTLHGIGESFTADSVFTAQQYAGIYSTLASVNAFRIFAATGNIASGSVRVYGVAK